MFFEYTFLGICIVVFLYFPGSLFRKFYFTGPYSKEPGWDNLQHRFVKGFLTGILIHISIVVIYCLYKKLTVGNYESFKNIYTKILEYVNLSQGSNVSGMSFNDIKQIWEYWVIIIFISIISGYLFFRLVTICNLDVRYKIFRFGNHWHYYFRGRILNEKKFNEFKDRKWVGTQADVLVKTSEGNILYTGVLSDYDLSPKECELKTIYLINWMRYSKRLNAYKELPGEFLVIPFENVYNINLRYIYETRHPLLSRRWGRYRNAFKSIFILTEILSLIIFSVSRYRYVGLTRVLFAILPGFGIFLFTLAIIMTLNPNTKNKYQGRMRDLIITNVVMIIILSVVFSLLLKLWP